MNYHLYVARWNRSGVFLSTTKSADTYTAAEALAYLGTQARKLSHVYPELPLEYRDYVEDADVVDQPGMFVEIRIPSRGKTRWIFRSDAFEG